MSIAQITARLKASLANPVDDDGTPPSMVDARIKGGDEYDHFVYNGTRPVRVEFRGKPVIIDKGTEFGVRPSSNRKDIRLVVGDDLTRVITLTNEQAQALAKSAKPSK